MKARAPRSGPARVLPEPSASLAGCPFGADSWAVGPGLLALAAALGLIGYFVREHDLVGENWRRTARWIGDNFDALRLPASVPWVE